MGKRLDDMQIDVEEAGMLVQMKSALTDELAAHVKLLEQKMMDNGISDIPQMPNIEYIEDSLMNMAGGLTSESESDFQ